MTTRHVVGEALAGRLFAAEAAIDLALVETASLMAMLPTARADLYLSAVTGQRVFDGAAASVSALTAISTPRSCASPLSRPTSE